VSRKKANQNQKLMLYVDRVLVGYVKKAEAGRIRRPEKFTKLFQKCLKYWIIKQELRKKMI
jgi:hypothetical protein